MIKKKGSPLFWILLLVWLVVLSVAIGIGLAYFYNFLKIYEQTRPAHFAEENYDIIDESNETELKKYLTNKSENEYEGTNEMLDAFYRSIEGKKLSFGRLAGKYTEKKPVYALTADGEHVATLSLVMKDSRKDERFDLHEWEIDSVTINCTPQYSYAVTIPSSMTLYINGEIAPEQAKVSEIQTETPISYVNYAAIGLYNEPQINVTDRFGREVTLQKDEKTGGLFYELSFARAPGDTEVSFGNHVLTNEYVLEDNIDSGIDFSIVDEMSERFEEYSGVKDIIGEYPTYTEYFIDFMYTDKEIKWADRFGNSQIPTYDKEKHKYSTEIVSDDSEREENFAYALEFLEKYTEFVIGGSDAKPIKKYFPDNSKYYKLISGLDNRWYHNYKNLRFENYEEIEYQCFAENLAFLHFSVDQKMEIGKETCTYPQEHLMWLIKMDDKWYIFYLKYEQFTIDYENLFNGE